MGKRGAGEHKDYRGALQTGSATSDKLNACMKCSGRGPTAV